ncbi:ammonium transporter [Candidatus Micrarchaeota archaeon]|nr:ammonium transporter [Candidatus Micrarchaeota archaeon]
MLLNRPLSPNRGNLTREKSGRRLLFLLITSTVLLPGVVFAAEGADISSALDSIWVVIAAAMVFLMHAGFAMVETGFTRAKNAGNIIMKNFMTFSGGSLSFLLIGFLLMFGLSSGGFVGSGVTLGGSWEHLELGIPLYVFLIFQTVFAATSATIVSGAVAERIRFSSYLIYSIVLTAVIYPVVGHWVWGGGWLSEMGFVDFAGSTVVHFVGGCAALVGAYFVGPRLGKYNEDGSANAIPGHSITMGALGVFILWFGWFGFNGGSTLSAFDPVLGLVIVNTNISAAAAAVMAMFVTWLKYRKPDVSMALNGGLAGLVAITAGCASVSFAGAAVIGIMAGILVVYSVEILDKKVYVDDPVGAVSVHGICGAFGTIMVGLFAVEGGLFYGGGTALLGVQVLGVLGVLVWVGITATILFGILKAAGKLRVSREEEIRGLDIKEHGMEAYADFVPR